MARSPTPTVQVNVRDFLPSLETLGSVSFQHHKSVTKYSKTLQLRSPACNLVPSGIISAVSTGIQTWYANDFLFAERFALILQ